VDPNNPVVRLCTEGMLAESEGRQSDARRLFLEAWNARVDDYDGCVAAHYLARHQDSAAEILAWNLTAWRCAQAVPDGRAGAFQPSLLLNLGHSYETLGDESQARRCFEEAKARIGDVPAGDYLEMLADGVARALSRIR